VNKLAWSVVGTIATAAAMWVAVFMVDSAVARADQRWLQVVAFQEFQGGLAEQEARKELRQLQREIADVQYRLTNAEGEERGRLEERLRVLLEQQAEIQSQLGEAS